MSVLVTVGTTHFEDLIKVVDSVEFGKLALSRGYTRLVLQYGPHAEYIPNILSLAAETDTACAGLEVVAFELTHDFASVLNTSSLVISHAGTGNIMEALKLEKRMVVVVNETLMDNHQREIADALAAENHFFVSTPSMLLSDLKEFDFERLTPALSSLDVRPFRSIVDSEMGFD